MRFLLGDGELLRIQEAHSRLRLSGKLIQHLLHKFLEARLSNFCENQEAGFGGVQFARYNNFVAEKLLELIKLLERILQFGPGSSHVAMRPPIAEHCALAQLLSEDL